MTKKFLFLSAMVLMLASCGNADNALEEIVNGGTTQEDIIKYGFKLTDLDGVDRTEAVTSLKMYKADGTPVATAEVSADHKVTITSSDLSAAGITSATDFWFDATIGGQAYVAKVNIDPKALSSETPKTLAMATLGDVILSDGKFYVAGTADAAAKICYLGSETGDADYKHGLALALSDEGTEVTWETAKNSCEGKTPAVTNASSWMMPSKDQWDNMINASGGYAALRDGFSSVGGTNMVSGSYWSSTEKENYTSSKYAYPFGSGYWDTFDLNVSIDKYARACLAF